MEEKKKRGCNYTAAEKEILLTLIKKYRNIIDNKETNARMILRKREAWVAVRQQYNVVAVSGTRTWQQLRHLYENLKQRTKKNITKDLQIYERIKEKTLLHKILPVENINNKRLSEVEALPELIINAEDSNDNEHMTSRNMAENNKHDDVENTIATIYQAGNKRQSSTSEPIEQKKSEEKESNMMEQYYKAKLRNANLEYKYLIKKNKMEMNKYKIEMQILKLKLIKLKHHRKQ